MLLHIIKTSLIAHYLSFISVAFSAENAYEDRTVLRLISVYDGDTIRVDIANCANPMLCKNISIRIFGIDTPEIRGKCHSEKQLAKIARDKVREILDSAKIIEIKNIKRGKYFRIIASVFADGVAIADLLIDQKLAVKYFGGKKQSWCR